jgi:thioesterase domain-containing protein
MVPLQSAGSKPPFFMVDSYPYFLELVELLGADQPVISLIGHEDMLMAGCYSIADEAARHVETILERYPAGPFLLGGCSASGLIAYEAAQQLSALGYRVSTLVLFDTPNPYYMREYSALMLSLNSYREDLSRLKAHEIPMWAAMKFKRLLADKTGWLKNGAVAVNGGADQMGPSEIRIQAARKYRPAPYSGKVMLFRRHHGLTGRYRDPKFGWGEAVRGDLQVCQMDAVDHLELFKSPIERAFVAQKLREQFDEAAEASSVREQECERENRTG